MSHHAPRIEDALLSRRELLRQTGMGMGSLALADILASQGLVTKTAHGADAAGGLTLPGAAVPSSRPSANPLLPKLAPRPATAKRVVHLFMNGGPSHVDTFDPKPMLDRHNGKPVGTNLPTERKTGAAMASPFRFRKYGESGIEVSDLFAHTAGMIDDICVIRSMHADVPNHEPSLMLMNCGEAPGSAVRRLLGPLRAGNREPESPRVHCDVPGRVSDCRVAKLAGGLSAGDLSRNIHR